MPFLTEELWQKLPRTETQKSLAFELFPEGFGHCVDTSAEREMELLQEAITALRNIRAEMKIDARRKVAGELGSAEPAALELFRAHQEAILRLASLSELKLAAGALAASPESGQGGSLRHAARFDARIPFTAADLQAEVTRLRKEKQKLEKELGGMRERLADREFRRKAPDDVVRGLEQRQAEYNTQYQKVSALLRQLESRLAAGKDRSAAQP